MRKTMLYAVVFASILILGSFIVVAKNENAPGQWKQTNEYANHREFVQALHMKIWERMLERNQYRIDIMGKENLINPIGLLKLLKLLTSEEESEEE